jgi:hypothetical protein
MKRLALILAVSLTATLAWGTVQWTRIPHLNVIGKTLLGGSIEANAITRSLYGSETMNFASVTTTCEDSAGATVTGALVGDACVIGMPATLTGAGTGLHSTFSCYVSGTNTVKGRHCASGTADNPGNVLFTYRIFSAQ